MSPDDTVGDMKSQLQALRGWRKAWQKLRLVGNDLHWLEDARTVSSYGLVDGSHVILEMTGSGGAGPKSNILKKKTSNKLQMELLFRDMTRRGVVPTVPVAHEVARVLDKMEDMDRNHILVFKSHMGTLGTEAMSAMIGCFPTTSGGSNEARVLQLAPFFYGSLHDRLSEMVTEATHHQQILDLAMVHYFNQSYVDAQDKYMLDQFKKDVINLLSSPRPAPASTGAAACGVVALKADIVMT